VEKQKTYPGVRFDAKTITMARTALAKISPKISHRSLTIRKGQEEWSFETADEFLAAADSAAGYFFSVEIPQPYTSLTISFGKKFHHRGHREH
jgi:hypothetical protein